MFRKKQQGNTRKRVIYPENITDAYFKKIAVYSEKKPQGHVLFVSKWTFLHRVDHFGQRSDALKTVGAVVLF